MVFSEFMRSRANINTYTFAYMYSWQVWAKRTAHHNELIQVKWCSWCILAALHEYKLIVDDTSGKAATAVQVLDFVFEVLGTVGGLTDDSYIFDGAVMLKRPDICKALEIGKKPIT